MARWRRCRRKATLSAAKLLARCSKGRDVVRKFLSTQNRIRWIEPEGAFYGFLHVEGMKDSLGFASDLVHNARVGVAPGSAFAPPDDVRSTIPSSASASPRIRREWRPGWSGWEKQWPVSDPACLITTSPPPPRLGAI